MIGLVFTISILALLAGVGFLFAWIVSIFSKPWLAQDFGQKAFMRATYKKKT